MEVEQRLAEERMVAAERDYQRLTRARSRVDRLRSALEAEKKEAEKERLWVKILTDTAGGEERAMEKCRDERKESSENERSHVQAQLSAYLARLAAVREEKLDQLFSLFVKEARTPAEMTGTLSLPGSEAEIRSFPAAALEAPLCQLMKFLQLATRYAGVELAVEFSPRGMASLARTGEGDVPFFSSDGRDHQLRINFRAYSLLVTAAGELALRMGRVQEKGRPFLFLSSGWKK